MLPFSRPLRISPVKQGPTGLHYPPPPAGWSSLHLRHAHILSMTKLQAPPSLRESSASKSVVSKSFKCDDRTNSGALCHSAPSQEPWRSLASIEGVPLCPKSQLPQQCKGYGGALERTTLKSYPLKKGLDDFWRWVQYKVRKFHLFPPKYYHSYILFLTLQTPLRQGTNHL